MLSALSQRTWQSVRLLRDRKHSICSLARAFSTGEKGGGGVDDKGSGNQGDEDDDADYEDEFGLSGFDLEIDEEEELEAKLKQVTESSEEVTPELATELVAKMVESATRSMSELGRPKADIIPAVTPHTISVLRASRISTNTVQAAASDVHGYPITKKVSAKINISDLNLSRPTEEALKAIAGPRVHKDGEIRFSSQKYPSLAENRAHVISSIDRLVAAARISVGESVNGTPLRSWEEVVKEVEMQASEEIAEAGGVSVLLGREKQ